MDDSPHHRESARALGLESAYIVIPQYGSPEDATDPLAWVRLVETAVSEGRTFVGLAEIDPRKP